MLRINEKTIKTIKRYLETKRREIENRLKTIRQEDPFAHNRPLPNAASDDDAAEFSGHERAEALRRETTRIQAKIKKALAKIGVGTYGKCEKCGQPIDAARLEVMPMADLCFECERKQER